MSRQSISLTDPNAKWVKSQVDSREYTSMSDVVNDLVRQARRQEGDMIEKIRAMLIEEEKGHKSYAQNNPTVKEQLDAFKEKAKVIGLL